MRKILCSLYHIALNYPECKYTSIVLQHSKIYEEKKILLYINFIYYYPFFKIIINSLFD